MLFTVQDKPKHEKKFGFQTKSRSDCTGLNSFAANVKL